LICDACSPQWLVILALELLIVITQTALRCLTGTAEHQVACGGKVDALAERANNLTHSTFSLNGTDAGHA
jgi:hypothetical protein